MAVTGLANLAVKVDDLEQACAWFEAAGAAVTEPVEWENGRRADVQLGALALTLFTQAIYEDACALPAEGFLHPALFVDDLDAELARHVVLWGPRTVSGIVRHQAHRLRGGARRHPPRVHGADRGTSGLTAATRRACDRLWRHGRATSGRAGPVVRTCPGRPVRIGGDDEEPGALRLHGGRVSPGQAGMDGGRRRRGRPGRARRWATSSCARAAGAGLDDVVKTTVYVASSDRSDLVAAWEVVHRHFGEHEPPSTLLGVTVLGYPDQLVEVEAVAALAD